MIMAYTTIAKVRLLSGLTSSDINDSDLTDLLTYAQMLLNHDIQVERKERILFISIEKQNKVDGNNTTYYTKHTPLGDRDDDGDVDASDLYVYTIDSTGTRATVTVSTVDDVYNGKFTVSAAVASTKQLYVEYYSSPVRMDTPHAMVALAAGQLCAALAFTKIEPGEISQYRVGKIAVTKTTPSFTKFLKDYQQTIHRITSGAVKREDFTYNV